MATPTTASSVARTIALRELRPGVHVPVLSSRMSARCWTTEAIRTMTPRATMAVPERTESPD